MLSYSRKAVNIRCHQRVIKTTLNAIHQQFDITTITVQLLKLNIMALLNVVNIFEYNSNVKVTGNVISG